MLLDWEEPIINRLQSATGMKVLTAPNLASIDRQLTPALHLVYGGYRADSSAGGVSDIRITWLVVVAVRNARTQSTGEAARSDAAPLVTQVIDALQGYDPPGATQRMRIESAPRIEFEAGFFALPLAFSASMKIYSPCP